MPSVWTNPVRATVRQTDSTIRRCGWDLWDTEHNLPRFLVCVCSSLSLLAAVV